MSRIRSKLWIVAVVTSPAWIIGGLLKGDPGLFWSVALLIGEAICLGSVIALYVQEWQATRER